MLSNGLRDTFLVQLVLLNSTSVSESGTVEDADLSSFQELLKSTLCMLTVIPLVLFIT